MSPIFRLCPQCGAKVPKSGLCPDCTRADNQRRNAKRKSSGRTTAAWNRLRAAAIARDGYACRRCGRHGIVGTLTVHLAPELAGNHLAASLADLVTLCRSCHGSLDAPRSHDAPVAVSGESTPGRKSRSELPSIG